MNKSNWVVFSDLDGALLDEKTFEWTAARAAIHRLQEARIPLVFVSSKTRPEIATLRAQMGIGDPFAAENGAIIVRRGQDDLILGLPAERLEQAAEEIAAETDTRIELLSQMARRRAMKVTGLPDCKVGPAQERAYSAPLVIKKGDPHTFAEAARRRNLRVIPGKRLLQLVGDHDKGDAVRVIRQDHPHAHTIGIGDGPNDLPMLRAVDRPVFQGRRVPTGLPSHAQVEPRSGPTGWSRAVWANIRQTPRIVGGAAP